MRQPFQFRLPWRRRLTVAATAAALLAGFTTAGPASAEVSTTPQTLAWGPCYWYSPDLGGPVPECATVTAPRDWAHPGAGPTVSVSISRVKATDTAHRKGILFTNPGGPGGAGSPLSWLIAMAAPKVAAQYDIIGMDPRGTGASTNLNCDVPLDPLLALGDYDTRDQSAPAVDSRQKLSKLIADACAANPLTRYVNTWQTTHDMDLVRDLLGEQKLNYLGYSYGTWLGAKYAALFPASTGKVVLDSNTAWVDDLATTWERMPLSFQRRFDTQLLAWITRSPIFSKYLGTSPAGVNHYYELSRARFIQYWQSPSQGSFLDSFVAGSLYTDVGLFGAAFNIALLKVCLVDNPNLDHTVVRACADDFVNQVFGDLSGEAAAEIQPELREHAASLLDHATVPDLGLDVVQTVVTRARTATGDTIPVNGVFWSVRCGDGGQWHSPDWWVNFARRMGPVFPLAGWRSGEEVCAYWTVPAQPLPNPDARRVPTILTVQGELDPATAYENNVRNVQGFAGTRLLAVDDGGQHGQYGLRGNGCVDDAVNAYLLDGVAPPASDVCEAVPLFMEDTVYPVFGPVDARTPPRGGTRGNVTWWIRQRLDKLVR